MVGRERRKKRRKERSRGRVKEKKGLDNAMKDGKREKRRNRGRQGEMGREKLRGEREAEARRVGEGHLSLRSMRLCNLIKILCH